MKDFYNPQAVYIHCKTSFYNKKFDDTDNAEHFGKMNFLIFCPSFQYHSYFDSDIIHGGNMRHLHPGLTSGESAIRDSNAYTVYNIIFTQGVVLLDIQKYKNFDQEPFFNDFLICFFFR